MSVAALDWQADLGIVGRLAHLSAACGCEGKAFVYAPLRSRTAAPAQSVRFGSSKPSPFLPAPA